MLKINTKGVSLVEAFLAAFIFIVSVSAILVTLTSIRKPAVNSDRSTEAALIAQKILDDLRSKVDSRDYDSGDLSLGSHPPREESSKDMGGGYSVRYGVFLVNSSDPNSARGVELTVDWEGTPSRPKENENN